MKQSPHYLSLKRLFRKLWNSGVKRKRREAVEMLLYASFYELCEAEPERKMWS